MAVFAVLIDKPNAKLGEVISTKYPNDHFKISDNHWIVRADSITKEVAENLDVRTGAFGRVVVLGLTGSRSGFHVKTVWEWLDQKVDGA